MMERDKEIIKLVNVLRRTARMAMQVEWTGGNQDAASYCVDQFNRVLARLKELDPDITPIFEPLPAESSLTVAAMACRQVSAYYEERTGRPFGWGKAFGVVMDPENLGNFWCKSAVDFEDIGEIIRESLEELARRRKQKHEKEK
jgi:hypothetical protein